MPPQHITIRDFPAGFILGLPCVRAALKRPDGTITYLADDGRRAFALLPTDTLIINADGTIAKE